MDSRRATLLVDANATRREHLAQVLANAGIATFQLPDVESAVDMSFKHRVNCSLVWLGAAQSEEVQHAVRELQSRIRRGPMILLLPTPSADMVRAAFLSGATDCLADGIEENEILRLLMSSHHLAADGITTTASPSWDGIDHVTHLLPHRAFIEQVAAQRSACQRRGESFSFMLLDLDNFRRFQESLPAAFGDSILQWFATVLQGACRRGDLFSRQHVDRFAVAMPNANALQVMHIAERCRRLLAQHRFQFDQREFEVTASIGVSESTRGFIESEHQIMHRARLALDHGKLAGGNRVISWESIASRLPTRGELRELRADKVSHWMHRMREVQRHTCLQSTRALVAAVEARDPYTRSHSVTVAQYAEEIGRRLHLNDRMLQSLSGAALLHDVGKIGLPDAILGKPGPLTDDEFSAVKRHPEMALEILENVSFVSDERPLILHHHERHDGRGYPHGLNGSRIPIGARVLAVADAIDAMLSPRVYKNGYAIDRVRDELRAGAERQFDPVVVDTALLWLDENPIPTAVAASRESVTATPLAT